MLQALYTFSNITIENVLYRSDLSFSCQQWLEEHPFILTVPDTVDFITNEMANVEITSSNGNIDNFPYCYHLPQDFT